MPLLGVQERGEWHARRGSTPPRSAAHDEGTPDDSDGQSLISVSLTSPCDDNAPLGALRLGAAQAPGKRTKKGAKGSVRSPRSTAKASARPRSPAMDGAISGSGASGTPGGIRTPDFQIRSLTLYPAELRAPGCGLDALRRHHTGTSLDATNLGRPARAALLACVIPGGRSTRHYRAFDHVGAARPLRGNLERVARAGGRSYGGAAGPLDATARGDAALPALQDEIRDVSAREDAAAPDPHGG